MGGKARQIFGTVLGLGALLASGGTLGPAIGAYWGALAGTAVAYGAWSAKEARRKAERAAERERDPRKTTLRGGAVAKYYVYGRDWVPGVVAGHREPQSKADPYFWLVLALPIAHKIEGIEHICFGDDVITPLTADGSARPGPFNKEFTKSDILRGIVPANRIITVQGKEEDRMESIDITGPIHLAVTRPTPTIVTGDDTYQDVIAPDATATKISATQIRLDGAEPGQQYTITYSYKFTRVYIKCWTYLGTEDQVANQELIAATAHLPESSIQKWRATDKLQGVPYIILRFHVDKDVFPNLLENISILPIGKSILDTRDGVNRWSNNPALCARDYVVNECGVLAGEVLPNARATDQFHDQVNYCDVDVPIWLPDGSTSTEPRYRANIALSTEAKPIDNLGLLLSTCDGSVVPSGASFDIRVGCYEEPTVELDDSDFAGAPEIVKGLSKLELFNGVRARFQNAQKPFWPQEDAPPYLSEFYKERQGGREVTREIDLRGTVSPYMAHRICKQTLLRAMQGMRVKAMFNTKVMQLSPEQTVWLTSRSLGLESKVFRIKSIRPNGLHQYELEMQEDSPLLYEWDFDEAAGVDPAPNTNLPSVRDVPLIEALSADSGVPEAVFGPGGEVQAQCRVAWAPVTNMLVLNGGHIELRYKRTTATGWTYSPHLEPTTREHRFPVTRGDVWIIGARCVNSFVAGQWVEIKEIVDDAPTPYLAGNLLQNARLEVEEQVFGFQPIVGWENPAPNPGTFGVSTTGFQGGGTGGAAYAASWQQNDARAGNASYVFSKPVAVFPGDRMVGFALLHSMVTGSGRPCGLAIAIVTYNSARTQVSATFSQTVRPTTAPGIVGSLREFALASVFTQVPSSAVSAKLMIVGSGIGNGGEGDAITPRFARPYLGIASVGQITLPPWSA